MSATRPPILVVLRAHLLADPRKTGVLVVLCLVMAFVYGRLMWRKYSPSSVLAASTASTATAAPGTGDAKAAKVDLPPAPARLALSSRPSPELARDPFAMRNQAASPDVPGEPVLLGPDGTVANLQDDMAAAELNELVLQSTLCGPSPVACISGRVVRPGEQLGSFIVQRIEPTQVVLQRGQMQAVLSLKR